ncbi:MAG: hypothetical protein AAF586_09880 [Planctomycetota bacterium]
MFRVAIPTTIGAVVLMVVTLTWTPATAMFVGVTYDATGNLVVRGSGGMREKMNVDLTVAKRKVEFDQTNGNSPLSGTLRLDKKVGTNDKKVNAKVKGKLANRRDAGTVDRGKFKIKENRSGVVSLSTSLRGKVTKGDAKGATFSIKLKG